MKKPRYNYAKLAEPTLNFLRKVEKHYHPSSKVDRSPLKDETILKLVHDQKLPARFVYFLPTSGVIRNDGCKRMPQYVYNLGIAPTIKTAERFIIDFQKHEKIRLHKDEVVTSISSPHIQETNVTKIVVDTRSELNKHIDQLKQNISLQVEQIGVKRFEIKHPENPAINMIVVVDMVDKTVKLPDGITKMLEGTIDRKSLPNARRLAELLVKSLEQVEKIY